MGPIAHVALFSLSWAAELWEAPFMQFDRAIYDKHPTQHASPHSSTPHSSTTKQLRSQSMGRGPGMGQVHGPCGQSLDHEASPKLTVHVSTDLRWHLARRYGCFMHVGMVV